MAALYDLFRTPQPKGEKKVRYHARSVVTGKMTTRDLIKTKCFQGRGRDGCAHLFGRNTEGALAEGKSVQIDGVGAKNYGVSRN